MLGLYRGGEKMILFLRYYLLVWLTSFIGVMLWIVQPWAEEVWIGAVKAFSYRVFTACGQLSFIVAVFLFALHMVIKSLRSKK